MVIALSIVLLVISKIVYISHDQLRVIIYQLSKLFITLSIYGQNCTKTRVIVRVERLKKNHH